MSDEDTRVSLDAIRRIVHSLRSPGGPASKRLGPARLFVLHALAETPDQSLGELATRTRTEASSVSVVIRHLVSAGYATRTKSVSDARRAVLRLTTAGRAVVRRAPVAPQERLFAALDALAKPKQTQLARLLTQVVEGMGLDATTPALFFEAPAARATRSRV